MRGVAELLLAWIVEQLGALPPWAWGPVLWLAVALLGVLLGGAVGPRR